MCQKKIPIFGSGAAAMGRNDQVALVITCPIDNELLVFQTTTAVSSPGTCVPAHRSSTDDSPVSSYSYFCGILWYSAHNIHNCSFSRTSPWLSVNKILCASEGPEVGDVLSFSRDGDRNPVYLPCELSRKQPLLSGAAPTSTQQ